jgi:hypothetical protein
MDTFIFKAEADLQPHLQEGCYTFIGPENEDLLGNFISFINNATADEETQAISYKLLNKNAIKQALSFLPKAEKLTIYVVEGSSPYGVVYATATEYCAKLGLALSISPC